MERADEEDEEKCESSTGLLGQQLTASGGARVALGRLVRNASAWSKQTANIMARAAAPRKREYLGMLLAGNVGEQEAPGSVNNGATSNGGTVHVSC